MKIYNNMKIWLAALLVSFSGCSDDYLDVPPRALYSDETFDPSTAVVASYNVLAPVSQRWSTWRLNIIGDIMSDDGWKGGETANDQPDMIPLENFEGLNGSNSIVRDAWNLNYQRIFRINWALQGTERLVNDRPALYGRYIGELKFLRAYHYFQLVRTFGGVPIIDQPLYDNREHNRTRNSVEEVYAFIEADLLDAADRLPVKSGYPAAELGRATQGAAQGLLGKVYVYQQKWNPAFEVLGNVIASEEYQLMPDFRNIFRRDGEHGSESLFEITFAPSPEQSMPTSHAVAQRGRIDFQGWGLNGPTSDLLNSFEEGDPRIIHTITFHGDQSEQYTFDHLSYGNPEGMHSRKAFKRRSDYAPSSANDGENLRILRYADVLLLYAEAANEINQTAEALSKLEMVRARARNSSRTDDWRSEIAYTLAEPEVVLPEVTVTDQNLLRDIIWEERRSELAMEGERYFDLVRQGRAGEVLRAFAAANNTAKGRGFIDGVHERWPIPQDEIDLTNGLITQNPGY